MLRDVRTLKGFTILARDGEIGRVNDVFFDDEKWAVRYFVVDTGNWLTGRKVLLSPSAIESVDWEQSHLRTTLTQAQVRNSPDVDAHMPVSRQKEIELSRYFNWPYYWGGVGLWGAGAFPVMFDPVYAQALAEGQAADPQDRHLYSMNEVRGYRILAEDGEFGNLESLILDDANWAIRYAVIDTINWWPSKSVLMAPEWISSVSWDEQRVHVGISQETIKNAPEYDPMSPITREYERQLHDYYGLDKYWEREEAA